MYDCRLDSVDQVHTCRPANAYLSTVALGSVAQFLKGSNSVLDAISKKCKMTQRSAFSLNCTPQRLPAAGNVSEPKLV